jgi:hypothetical protein
MPSSVPWRVQTATNPVEGIATYVGQLAVRESYLLFRVSRIVRGD